MTALRCSAMQCMYNNEQLCCKGDIRVGKDNARTIEETSCESFREKTGSGMQNGVECGCGRDTIHVNCSACSCSYNENQQCHAGSIDIDGRQAHTQEETCCRTFRQ